MKFKFFRPIAFLLLFTFSFHTLANACPVSVSSISFATGKGEQVPYILYDIKHSLPLPLHPSQPITKKGDSHQKGDSHLSKFIENGMMQFGIQVPFFIRHIKVNGASPANLWIFQKRAGQVAKDSIDQRLEKSKMSAFAKSILSTVTSAGLSAIGQAVMDYQTPSSPAPQETAGARAPPTGLSAFWESIKDLGTGLQGLVSTALKDAGGAIRSIFVGGASGAASGRITNQNGSLYYTPLTYGSQPLSYENVIANAPRIQYGLDEVEGDFYRSFDDQGNITNIQFDSTHTSVRSQETIGNLPQSSLQDTMGGWLGGFSQARNNFLDGVSQGISSGIDSWIGSPSDMPTWAYEFSYTTLHTVGDALNGMFVEPFNLGRDLPAIGNSLSRMIQSGEWKDALGNYFTTGRPFSDNTPNLNQAALLSLSEFGRAASLVPMVGGVVKGVGAIGEGLTGLGRGGFASFFGGVEAGYLDLAHGGSLAKLRGIYEEGINPKLFNNDARFGPGFYLAEDSETVIRELAAHHAKPDLIVDFRLNMKDANRLDLTDPGIKRAYQFDRRFTRDYTSHQAIAQRAKQEGYNVIKFESFRNKGHYNYVVLDDFDKLLKGRYPFK